MFQTTNLIEPLAQRGIHLSSSQVYRLVVERPERLSLKMLMALLDDGFDFLSFTIRRYHTHHGSKVLTKPSRDAVKKIRCRTAEELRALRGASPLEVIATMNPIIRGQANYFRPGASTKAYQTLDNLWQHLYKWARRRHPTKGRQWVVAAISARSTRTDTIGGSTATNRPAPTSADTPGQRSSGTSRSPAGTHLTTRPSPNERTGTRPSARR